MSGDKFEFEYPDQAGYPDGMGTLHEGIEEDAAEEDAAEGADAAATAAEQDLEEFALDDEEDVDGNV
ncbi:hypothetical protein LQ757_16490 [Agromyces sp. SYSU K20354]|uniref:hypothetical protein n=1 Tax=Agromyces cavernae TaxID=2898659 RepID=UPI001E52669E|nr:hypothetical protein [Agromyces cavernae]MCD2443881.1 hypothetical protein [Agromyces cavernae]